MTKITASGKINRKEWLTHELLEGYHDYQTIEVIGEKDVEQYICEDIIFMEFIKMHVEAADGRFANYTPRANSMLQAYCLLCMIFRETGKVDVEGELEEVEYDPEYDPNAIY